MSASPNEQRPRGPCPPAEDVVAFALGEAAPRHNDRVQGHIRGCATCRALVEETRATRARLRALTHALPERDLAPGVLARLPADAWQPPTPRRLTRRVAFPRRTVVRTAAAAVVVIACAYAMLHTIDRAATSSDKPPIAHTRAARRGVDWLLARQRPSGGWDVRELGGQLTYAPALNGLAVLALTRSGRDPATLVEPLTRAADALQRYQRPDGRFGKRSEGVMYNQGIATLALLATYHTTTNNALKPMIEKALAFIREHQSPAGGWGYGDPANGVPNTSITAWQVQALLQANRLGWHENRLPIRKALAWLAGTVNGHGYFGYEYRQQRPEAPGTVTMMGAYCLLAARHLEIPVDPALVARVTHGIRDLAREEPADYYGTYFYAAALGEADPEQFRDLLASAESSLVGRQRTSGYHAGTWPADDRWGTAGGQVYSTSMALMAMTAPADGQPRQRSE